jgi:hypothetical protein
MASQRDPPDTWTYPLETLADYARRLLSFQRQLQLCREHHLPAARAHILENLQNLLRSWVVPTDQVTRSLPPQVTPPSLRDIVAEVGSLYDEFPDTIYDPKAGTLTATTDPITLEDIRLGSFKVVLELARAGQHARRECYRIIALDPNPAASNDHVTHPHVSDEHLCEGDAAVPIRAALAEGRLADFFTLVRCVLTTYNPASPYVSLDNWFGQPCHDCGDTVDEDDRFWCSGCDHDLCEGCISSCRSCDDSRCRNCLTDCPECEEPVCSECLKHCKECGSSCCRSCLADGLCPSCHETPEGETDHEPDVQIVLATGANAAESPCEKAA